MQRVVRAAVAALAATFVLSSGPALAASAEKGKDAFLRHGCFQCHGTVGQGAQRESGGRVLARTALPLEAFVAFVRTTNREMPPYSEKILSNDELGDIYAYLQSLPAPPDYKSVPLLNQ